MAEDTSNLQKYAMHFGTYLGVYWILKFILFPLGFHIPFLSLLFVVLTLAVPFIAYHYTKTYRDRACRGHIRFSHAALFCMIMFMFASLLAAVAHYAYFQFIDHGFIVESYARLWDELMEQNPSLMENKEAIKNLIDTAQSANAIQITMQIISWDCFWGAILSIPIGIITMKSADSIDNRELQA